MEVLRPVCLGHFQGENIAFILIPSEDDDNGKSNGQKDRN